MAEEMHALIKTLRVEAAAAEAREAKEKEAQQAKRRVIRQELIDHLGSPGGLAPDGLTAAVAKTEAAGVSDAKLVADAKAVLAGLEAAVAALRAAADGRSPYGLRAALERAAGARLVDGHPAAAKARAVLERESRDPRWEYVDRAALQGPLLDGTVRLLRPEWVLDWFNSQGPPYHNPGKPLPKRQDCPEEAFVDVQAMTREEFLTMDVVAISYCWLAKDHPDPNREHLAVIARILELHARGSYEFACFNKARYTRPTSDACGGAKWGQLSNDEGMDKPSEFDHLIGAEYSAAASVSAAAADGSDGAAGDASNPNPFNRPVAVDDEDLKDIRLAEKEGRLRTGTIGPMYLRKEGYGFGGGDGRPVGVFFDWCSLHQDAPPGSRSDEERDLFQGALQNVDLWYAHRETIVWCLSYLPNGVARTETYHESGWPAFERFAGSMLARPTNLLDIDDEVRAQLLRPVPLRPPLAPPEKEPNADGALVPSDKYAAFLESEEWKHWLLSQRDYLQLSLDTMVRERGPPLTPEAFNVAVRAKFFPRGGTDLVEVVKPRYAAAFEATVAGASTLEFPGLGFTDSEARELLDVIVEHCTALKVLDLSDNNALTVPLTEWGPVAFAKGLQKLSLARNAALEASPLGAFGKCTALEVLDLRRCERVKGDVSEVMALVNLEVLNLSGTRVGGETYSLYPFVRMRKLYLNGTKLKGDLSQLAPLRLLQCLSLAGTAVVGDVKALAELLELTLLNLEGTAVGGDPQTAFWNHRKLTKLNLRGTRVDCASEADKNRLRQALPDQCRLAI